MMKIMNNNLDERGKKVMNRVLKKEDLVDIICDRTEFYKIHIKTILDELDNIIVENMMAATESEPSEIRLSLGFTFGGRFVNARKARDPRNGNEIVSPAKIIPYAKFSQNFRKKINEK